jgi:hypothetical protein
MIEVDQDLQAARHDVVRLAALDIDHESHAARVMLVTRVVQALLLGRLPHPKSVSMADLLRLLPQFPCREKPKP